MMHNVIVGEVPVWKKTQYAKSIAKTPLMRKVTPCENRPGFPWISLDYLEKILQLIPG